jgi:hypothetical protein
MRNLIFWTSTSSAHINHCGNVLFDYSHYRLYNVNKKDYTDYKKDLIDNGKEMGRIDTLPTLSNTTEQYTFMSRDSRSWVIMRSNEIPYESKRNISSTIWKFANDFNDVIQLIEKFVFNSSPYAIIHIRRTDKISSGESEETQIETYCQALKNTGLDAGKFFLMTDDALIIPTLGECLSSTLWEIVDWNSIRYTLSEHKSMISDRVFSSLFSEDKLFELFLSVELALRSSHAIVTFSSNVGRFIGLMHQHRLKEVTSLDHPEWSSLK